MHLILGTFTSHCEEWPLGSALALLKDGNWVLLQVYNPTQIKRGSFLILCRNLLELYRKKTLFAPRELCRLVWNLKALLRKTPTTH